MRLPFFPRMVVSMPLNFFFVGLLADLVLGQHTMTCYGKRVVP